MCGIAGAIGALDATVIAAVRRASAAEAHRGPDAEGFWKSGDDSGPGVALAHRRLSILDLSADGMRLAATVRTLLGTKVLVYDLGRGRVERTVANGCSASLSPDGRLITVNGATHRKLDLYNWQTLESEGFVSAPEGLKFDNQYWSNHPAWLVSTSEGGGPDIYLHHVPSNTAYRVTTTGDCDRADLFITEFAS